MSSNPGAPSVSEEATAGTSVGNISTCYASGLLLLQDYKENQLLPSLLQQLYSMKTLKTEFHAACALVHCLMLESGFVLSSQEQDIEKFVQGLVALDYSHPAADGLVFTVTCNCLAQFVLVNGVVHPCVNTEEQVFTLQFKADQFVIKFIGGKKPVDGSIVYKNLSKLSRLFKENIAHKALNTMREELRLPPISGFLSLFPELLLRIFSYLNAKDVCAVAQTCSQLTIIANDDKLWRALFIKDFKISPSLGTSVKNAYKTLYLQKKEEKRALEHARDFPIYEPPRDPFGMPIPDVPEPFPGQVPGIIGGEFDLDPTFPYGPFTGRRQPSRPGFPGAGNPLPGSRFDPINPYGGRFRPGRGGGMFDDDLNIGFPNTGRSSFPQGNRFGGGFGGGFM